MAETHPNPFLRQIRHLIGSDPAAGLTDGQLLERFLTHRDEMAVEVLVRRYGPLVFGVCCRVLHNAHAAEDAFQATFLVLLRKAPSLTCYQPLGGWLYRVAYRLALRARGNEARRRQREVIAARNQATSEDSTSTQSDLVVALEEELQKLPEKHRTPLVLCYLEGKTSEQAAELLGCPRGSVSARLAQARDRLRSCLARRGFTEGSASIATVLATATTEAAVPLPLLSNTVRAAVWFASKEASTGGVVSAQAVALARGACRAMVVHKLQIAAAAMLIAAMLGTGATLLLRAAAQEGPAELATEPPSPEVAGEQLPNGVLARMGTLQLRHGDAIYFAAYTPDGKALLTAGRDGTVRLWEATTGKELRRFDWGEAVHDSKRDTTDNGMLQKWEQQVRDNLAMMGQAALSPGGTMVAASRRGVVFVWETATGKKVRQLRTQEEQLDQLAFSADGKSLLTVGPWQATAVWDVASGRCVRRHEGNPAGGFRPLFFADTLEQTAVVSGGWKYLAFRKQAENDGPWSIHIQERASGKELTRVFVGDGRAPLTFSPDEKVLVWAPFEAGNIVLSDVVTGKELRRLGQKNASYDLATNFAFSADGKTLAVSRVSHSIELWDLSSGKQIARVAPFSTRTLERPALAFSPDGKTVVSSLGGPSLRQFDAATGQEILRPANGHRASVSALALSADGKSLWTYGRGDPIQCWDWATGQKSEQRDVPSSAAHAVLAADGRFAFVAGKKVIIGGLAGKTSGQIEVGEERLSALALSPDGAFLATRGLDTSAVHLWDVTTVKARHTLGPAGDGPKGAFIAVTETTGVVTPELVFSPDGCCLAGAGPSRQLRVWDVATGNVLWEMTPRAGQTIERFAFSMNGMCLGAVHADRTVTLYETLTGQARGLLGTADPKNRRIHLTFSDSGGSGLMGAPRDAPVCLAFSPDGRYLALAQETPAIHLWDVFAGREVGQLQGHEGGVGSLLFSRDGRFLFSGGTDTTALTWDLTRLTRGQPARAGGLQPQTLDALWTDLADTDAGRAFDAMRQLSASPEQAVSLLSERLRPAQAADPKRVAQLLADLGSDDFESRRQAESELQGMGELAEPALRQALADDPPLALRKRLERLLEKQSVRAVGQLRELRAVELLECIGSANARQLLQALAGGAPGARLTREARHALQRLPG
jgi:RNA polymerase sigma factor (sigma-70 family)